MYIYLWMPILLPTSLYCMGMYPDCYQSCNMSASTTERLKYHPEPQTNSKYAIVEVSSMQNEYNSNVVKHTSESAQSDLVRTSLCASGPSNPPLYLSPTQDHPFGKPHVKPNTLWNVVIWIVEHWQHPSSIWSLVRITESFGPQVGWKRFCTLHSNITERIGLRWEADEHAA